MFINNMPIEIENVILIYKHNATLKLYQEINTQVSEINNKHNDLVR